MSKTSSPIQKHFDDVESDNYLGIRGKKGRAIVKQRKGLKVEKKIAKIDQIKAKTKSIGTLAEQGIEYKGAGANLLNSAGGIVKGLIGGVTGGLLGGNDSTGAAIQERPENSNTTQQQQDSSTANSIQDRDSNRDSSGSSDAAIQAGERHNYKNSYILAAIALAIIAFIYLRKK